MSGGREKVNAVIRYKMLKFRGLVASLTVMLTAALAAALAPALVANTPALAQSTVADTKHPRVTEVRPAEGATGVSPTSGEFSEGHKVVAFFSEEMKPGSAMWAIKLYKKGSDTQEDSTMGYNAAQRKVTLWPPNPLERGVTYKAVVSTRAKDLAGNRLDQNRNRDGLQPKVWYFTIEEQEVTESGYPRCLTDNGLDEYPDWSPDGNTVAFGRLTEANGRIYTVNADGGGLRKLTDPPEGFWDSEPSWSTDGTKIAFTRTSGKRPNRPDVFTMNADGTDIRKLTGKTEGAYSPGFSPDGERIVFVGWKGGNKLYVMNADGTNVRRVTPDLKGIVDESAPDWQPLP